MNPREVLFIGGNPQAHASVQIRAQQIAEKLGCDCRTGYQLADRIPSQYKVFVCVKPRLWPGDLALLAQRGKVIWDVIDELPPREHIEVYLASSRFAQALLKSYGRVDMIPHQHCNFSGEANAPHHRRAGWIGSRRWHPELPEVEHDTYFVDQMPPEQVAQAHRQIGIGLNFRKLGPRHDFHTALNSGVKLINCLGFGIPSVSAEEPAYAEYGGDCTITSTPQDCARNVRALQNDEALYNSLRQKCLERAPAFSIDAIARQYRQLFDRL